MKRVSIFCVFVFISVFSFVNYSSALIISEIQFDPVGSDTDREWLEIFNDTGGSVDLTQSKFFENNTNHAIEVATGDKNLLSGEYAVLVQDLNKFKTDFPDYVGKIFKSSFSLSNTGEVLSLKDKDGNILNTVNYSPASTGAGNGSTIVFDGANYVKSLPTPGTGTLSINATATTTSNTATTTVPNTSTTSANATDANGNFVSPIYYHRSYWPESEKIYVDAGGNRISVAGVDVAFEGKVTTLEQKPITNVNYFWSFGDGEEAEGKNVFHAYKYSGEYTVDLDVYANGGKNSCRIYVKVVEPELSIKLGNEKGEKIVEIANNTKDEVDIGKFVVKSFGGEFEHASALSKHLSIMPRKSVKLSQSTLKFATSTQWVSLNFPNGQELAVSHKNQFDVASTSSISVKVFSKQDFEKQNIPKVVAKAQTKVLTTKKKMLTSENPKKDVTIDTSHTNTFVIENKQDSFVNNLLNYFGI
jgi:hypothetical protein